MAFDTAPVEKLLDVLAKSVKIRIRRDEDLSLRTTFRIGGKAKFFIEPLDDISLGRLLKLFRKNGIQWRIIGAGSNLLVNDRGIDEPIISLKHCRNSVAGISEKAVFSFEGSRISKIRISVGAGTSLKRLLGLCIRMGWSGCEFLSGIPATVGGAVFMNAGTKDGSISEIIRKVELMNSEGEIYTVPMDSLPTGYRHSGIPSGHVVLGAEMELTEDFPEKVLSRIRSAVLRRKSTQPLTYPSAGCIFRNPPEGYPPAGWLIDRCGLKGYRIGGAQVSTVHANWIVNIGGARASDVMALIEHVKEKVFHVFGIMLEEEIKIW